MLLTSHYIGDGALAASLCVEIIFDF